MNIKNVKNPVAALKALAKGFKNIGSIASTQKSLFEICEALENDSEETDLQLDFEHLEETLAELKTKLDGCEIAIEQLGGERDELKNQLVESKLDTELTIEKLKDEHETVKQLQKNLEELQKKVPK